MQLPIYSADLHVAHQQSKVKKKRNVGITSHRQVFALRLVRTVYFFSQNQTGTMRQGALCNKGLGYDIGAVPNPPLAHCHFAFSFTDKHSADPKRNTGCLQSSLQQILELLYKCRFSQMFQIIT